MWSDTIMEIGDIEKTKIRLIHESCPLDEKKAVNIDSSLFYCKEFKLDDKFIGKTQLSWGKRSI